MLEKEYKLVNDRKIPKRMSDYTLEEIRNKLVEYHNSLNRQHGRKPKLSQEEAVYSDPVKEKARLWNNYRSILSRHEKIAMERWKDSFHKA